jgi:hypothetical protein
MVPPGTQVPTGRDIGDSLRKLADERLAAWTEAPRDGLRILGRDERVAAAHGSTVPS